MTFAFFVEWKKKRIVALSRDARDEILWIDIKDIHHNHVDQWYAQRKN